MVVQVRRARQLRGMTQQQLADKAGIGRSTISNIETGKYIPGVDVALLVAKALSCRVEDLFMFETEGKKWTRGHLR